MSCVFARKFYINNCVFDVDRYDNVAYMICKFDKMRVVIINENRDIHVLDENRDTNGVVQLVYCKRCKDSNTLLGCLLSFVCDVIYTDEYDYAVFKPGYMLLDNASSVIGGINMTSISNKIPVGVKVIEQILAVERFYEFASNALDKALTMPYEAVNVDDCELVVEKGQLPAIVKKFKSGREDYAVVTRANSGSIIYTCKGCVCVCSLDVTIRNSTPVVTYVVDAEDKGVSITDLYNNIVGEVIMSDIDSMFFDGCNKNMHLINCWVEIEDEIHNDYVQSAKYYKSCYNNNENKELFI